jgi:hypothetical protein
MESFRDYFREGVEKAGSMNKLGVQLRTSGVTVSRFLMGLGFPEDELIVRLAEYIGEDPAKLLLLRSLEKCPETSRRHWKTILKRYASVALIVACTFPSSLGFSSSNAEASIAPDNGPFMHYQTLIRDTLKRLLSLIARPHFSEMIYSTA